MGSTLRPKMAKLSQLHRRRGGGGNETAYLGEKRANSVKSVDGPDGMEEVLVDGVFAWRKIGRKIRIVKRR